MASRIEAVGEISNYTVKGIPSQSQEVEWHCEVKKDAQVTRGEWGSVSIDGCDIEQYPEQVKRWAQSKGWDISSFYGGGCPLEMALRRSDKRTVNKLGEDCTKVKGATVYQRLGKT